MRGRPVGHVLLLPASTAGGCSLIAWFVPGLRASLFGGAAGGTETLFLAGTLLCQVGFVVVLAEWIYARYRKQLRSKALWTERC